ncbi:hypothetical protein HGRIS_005043 [Hohenbuehelia grisea]|uniref:Uncharacterized protein n=1 Tax=Hohenbuehelia grisea TaxID=104357 RepID=A0ABR3JDT8_9AGAR
MSASSSRRVLTRQQRIALANDAGIAAPALTPAERAREKKLREDPIANVIGPLYVDCRRCGTRIKLSPKSVYDPFHWKTHRERCLRKPAGAAVAPRHAQDNSSKTELDQDADESTICPPARSISAEGDIAIPVTPPLTPDYRDEVEVQSDRDAGSEDSMTAPPDVNQASPVTKKATQLGNRSDAHRPPGGTVIATAGYQEHWKRWDWSCLKPRAFFVSEHEAAAGSLIDGINDPTMDKRERQLRRDAILSLSLLSQSAPPVS